MRNPVSLLPPNATVEECALDLTTARLADLPVLVRESWNPETCPKDLLPWLAWALSVDDWRTDWNESEKRAVIKNALYVHRKKGTLAALKRAVAPLGYQIHIIEWFAEEPPGNPFTFGVEANVTGKEVSEETYAQLLRLLDTNKNVRSQIMRLTIRANVAAKAYLVCGSTLMSGMTTTVYPHFTREISHASGLYFAMGQQTIDTLAVYPPA